MDTDRFNALGKFQEEAVSTRASASSRPLSSTNSDAGLDEVELMVTLEKEVACARSCKELERFRAWEDAWHLACSGLDFFILKELASLDHAAHEYLRVTFEIWATALCKVLPDDQGHAEDTDTNCVNEPRPECNGTAGADDPAHGLSLDDRQHNRDESIGAVRSKVSSGAVQSTYWIIPSSPKNKVSDTKSTNPRDAERGCAQAQRSHLDLLAGFYGRTASQGSPMPVADRLSSKGFSDAPQSGVPNSCSMPPTCTLAERQLPYLDRQITMALGASLQVRNQLASALTAVMPALIKSGLDQSHIMMYGSLSLGRQNSPQNTTGDTASALNSSLNSYLTDMSDIDFAVLAHCNAGAAKLAGCIIELCSVMGWRQLQKTPVPRFSITQWAFVSESGVHLDLTSIGSLKYWENFQSRQRRFQELFWEKRHSAGQAYGQAGLICFDAYMLLLKGFAAFPVRRVLSSFQATCLGIFVLHGFLTRPGHFVYGGATPAPLDLLRSFLNFCKTFFTKEDHRRGQRKSAGTDAAGGGGHLPTCSTHVLSLTGPTSRSLEVRHQQAPAQLFFADVEEKFGLPQSDWMNVLHNVDPEAVQQAATSALESWYTSSNAWDVWTNISRDVIPALSKGVNPARD